MIGDVDDTEEWLPADDQFQQEEDQPDQFQPNTGEMSLELTSILQDIQDGNIQLPAATVLVVLSIIL